MPEITLVGENSVLTAWGWEIALYLFLGGLVAGLMVLSGGMRLARSTNFKRSLWIADLAGLPLLGIGMICLFFDLANKSNVWRFYTSFQVSSAMSWGAWILLLAMILLFLRLISTIPAPRSITLLGYSLFPAPPASEEEAAENAARKPSPLAKMAEWTWGLLDQISRWTERTRSILALTGIVLGTGVGFYTGVLLSTIPSRPLWNTAILAPLFLVSGLASAGAFLCLFLHFEEHRRLVPFSILFCGIELLFLLAFIINLTFGTAAMQRAGLLLFNGVYGWVFWGLVLLIGLLTPAVLELLEMSHHQIKFIPARIPPTLKLFGGLALRFVIVYAGVLSFV